MPLTTTTRARTKLPKKGPFRYTKQELSILDSWRTNEVDQSTYVWWLHDCVDLYLFRKNIRPKMWSYGERLERSRNTIEAVEKCIDVLSSDMGYVMAGAYSQATEKFSEHRATIKALEQLAERYKRFQAVELPKRRDDKNVDLPRNDFFEDLLAVWTSLLNRPISDGYQSGIGPTSAVVLFIAAAARPVVGNDKASLDAIRHFIRKTRYSSSA